MRIAIVGDALSTRGLAPYVDPTWTLWGQGNGHLHMPRADVYLQTHGLRSIGLATIPSDFFAAPARLGASEIVVHRELLDAPFVRREDGTPTVRVFPFDDVLAAFPRRYFTSSIAWLIGYAVTLRPEQIGIWGVDLSVGDEWGPQRGGVEYIIGQADALLGEENVIIPARSLLVRAPFLYGLQDEANRDARSVIADQRIVLDQELANYRKALRAAEDARLQLRARIDEARESFKRGAEPAATHERVQELERSLDTYRLEELKAGSAVGQMRARIDEGIHYLRNFTFPVDGGLTVDVLEEGRGTPAYVPDGIPVRAGGDDGRHGDFAPGELMAIAKPGGGIHVTEGAAT